jgi:hypothetical protein
VGGDLIHLGELVVGGGEADLQALGFAGPAFAPGFADAGGQVVADLCQPWPLGRVGPQQRAADAQLTEPNAMFEQVAADFGRLGASLSA